MSAKRKERAAEVASAVVSGSCVVCGLSDARALCAAELADGRGVPLCGTHDLVYRRANRRAASVEDLRAMTGERRAPRERRGAYANAPHTDELALLLASAFVRERRSGSPRRA